MRAKVIKRVAIGLLILIGILLFLLSISMNALVDVINVEGINNFEKESSVNISDGIPYFKVAEFAYQNEKIFTDMINYTGIIVICVLLYLLIKTWYKLFKKNKRGNSTNDIKEDNNQKH